MLPITAYADRYSVAPGETIAFKVSSAASEDYEARLVRVISGDPNPAGPGIREQPVDAAFAGRYPSRVQPIYSGSYARVAGAAPLDALRSFTVTAIIWPTLPVLSRRQGLVSRVDAATGAGFTLEIDEQGSLAATLSDGTGTSSASVGKALRARAWYRVFLSYDADRGELALGQQAFAPAMMVDDSGVVTASAAFGGVARGAAISCSRRARARPLATPTTASSKRRGCWRRHSTRTRGSAPRARLPAPAMPWSRRGISPARCRRRASSTPAPTRCTARPSTCRGAP